MKFQSREVRDRGCLHLALACRGGRDALILPVPRVESVGLTGGVHSKLRIPQSQGQAAVTPVLRPGCGTWVSGSAPGPGAGKWGRKGGRTRRELLGRGGSQTRGKEGGREQQGKVVGSGPPRSPRGPARVEGLGRTGPGLYKRSHLFRSSHAPPGLARSASLQLSRKPALASRASLGPPAQCSQQHDSEQCTWVRGGRGGHAVRAAAAPALECPLVRPRLRGAASRSGQRVKRREGRAPARGAARLPDFTPPNSGGRSRRRKRPQPGVRGGNARPGLLAGLHAGVSAARKLLRADSADQGVPGLGDAQPQAIGVRDPP